MPRLYQVDAFTDTPFAGNPAAVCLMDHTADEAWMQQVAAEMNLSETAFIYPVGQHRFHLRWFTPAVEVELCGHATLATSHILWETGIVPEDQTCVYQTLSGELRAKRAEHLIELDFPAAPTRELPPPPGLLESLRIEAEFVGLSTHDWLVVTATSDTVRKMKPEMDGLRHLGVRGVIVTAADETGDYDFISRFFAPGAGIDEDPVTGSAHCTLGPWWQQKTGKSEFRAFQASHRGGEMHVLVQGDRILLRGNAVTISAGELFV